MDQKFTLFLFSHSSCGILYSIFMSLLVNIQLCCITSYNLLPILSPSPSVAPHGICIATGECTHLPRNNQKKKTKSTLFLLHSLSEMSIILIEWHIDCCMCDFISTIRSVLFNIVGVKKK